jgi:MFS family permease
MQLFHFYNNHRKELSSDFWLFEFSVWLHTIARSVIAVFVPIFLLQLGYGIRTVIAYYLLFNLIDVPLNFAVEALLRRIGARRVIVLATLASIAYFLLLGRISNGSLLLLALLALLDAIYDTFYWVGHIYLFLNSSGAPKESNKHTGILYSIRTFGGMIGPLIGAGLLLFTSENFLILISVILFIFSIIPLIDLKHTADRPRVPHFTFRHFFKDPRDKRDYFYTFLTAIHAASDGVVWPLFIFTLFGTIKSVAYIAIIVSISKIVCSYLSVILRKKRRQELIALGAISLAVIWILRLLYPLPGFIYASVLIAGFLTLLVDVPIDVSLFERGRGMRALATATYHNVISMSGQLALYALLIVATSIFKFDFILAGLSMLLLAGISSAAIIKRQRISVDQGTSLAMTLAAKDTA